MKLNIAFILIYCSIFKGGVIQANEQMNWGVVHWPPMMILEGRNKDNGRYDILLKLFQENMPQYVHQNTTTNWNRLWIDIKKGRRICNFLALRTEERANFAIFSKVMSLTTSNRIIMTPKQYKKLGSPDSFSLAKLMNIKDTNGAIEKSRSYTHDIDNIINRYYRGSNLTKASINPENLIKMLLADRFQYLIEYPYSAMYILKQQNKPSNSLKSVRIEEIEDYSPVYLACPKNTWGEKVVSSFNNALEKLRHTDEYKNILGMWFFDEKEKNNVRKKFEAFSRNNN